MYQIQHIMTCLYNLSMLVLNFHVTLAKLYLLILALVQRQSLLVLKNVFQKLHYL